MGKTVFVRRMPVTIMARAIIIIGLMVAVTPRFGAAIDTPHSASNNISCGDCHGEALLNSPFWGGSYSPANIDDTVYNKLCLNCHRVTSGPYSEVNAPLVKTHSSLTTSNKYGDWTRECRNCHDPHYQRQKNYKTTDASNLYLAAGTITACVYNGNGTSTLTYSTITYKTGWDFTKLTKKTGDYRRTILFPNVSKLGYNYPLVAIDTVAKRITVTGDATVYLYPPTTFAATYGQYIKDIMDISADGSGVNKTVKFFDQTGVNSFADGNSTYDGVCEVCHTQTTHFRNNGGVPDQNHANIGGAAGLNCSTCHSHVDGFKPSCASCHGYPPPPLASIPLPTGSTTAGEHVFHVTTKGYQCSTCHFNSTGSGTTHNDNKITLGFVGLLGAYTGGSYDGQTSANYESSDPGTTVSKTGLKKCSNLYCHGGTMAPDGGTGSAIWDDPSSAACGTCHGATTGTPPTRGSHLKHAGSTMQLPCSDCHKGYTPTTIPSGMNTHVNNQANFAFDTTKNYIGSSASYNGTTTMLDAYGQCSTTYCHGSSTPTWGGASIACNGCHDASNTGLSTRHDRHYNTATVPSTLLDPNAHTASAYVYGCSNCHPTTSHARGPVSSVQDAEINGTKILSANYTAASSNLTDAKGFKYTTYGTCITVCHTRDGASGLPIVAAAWGTAPTSPNCGVCHNKAGDVSPVWSTPHTRHINTYSANTNFTCNACHSGTATNNTTINGAAGRNQHPNGVKDVSFNTFAGGTWTGTQCQNTYCHSNGTSITGSHPVILWSGTMTCSSCHPGTSIATGSHPGHVAVALYDCTKCHNVTVSNSSTISNYANHVNKLIDVAFDTASHVNGTYNGVASPVTKTPGTAYSICTNITCHNNGTCIWSGTTCVGSTPQWGTAGGCNTCHGNTTYTDYRKGAPLYASGSPKPNAHLLHTDARTTPLGEPQCNHCHRSVTNSNTAIDGTTPADHMNNAYNVVQGSTYKDGDNVGGAAVSVTNTYTYNGTPNTSTCSNVSCHPTGLAGTKLASTTKWSDGYRCTDCHNINMNNTTGYHHVMDSTAMANRTYPTSVPTSSATDSNRKCTICHVDHNILSPMLNASNTNGRSYNLRTAIGTTPTATTGYTNSDYATGGGICISCHNTELTKNTTAQKSETTSTTTMAVTDANFSASAHKYNVTSTMANDSTTFNSNCSKCHNAKNAETTTFQSSTNKFGTHDDTARRLVAALGGTLADPYEEAFCYRCHSMAADAIGGTKKSTDANDWYGAVTTMSAPSTSMYQVFQKTYKHNVAGYSGLHKPSTADETRTYLSANKHVECDDCHNPHAAKAGLHSSNQVHVAAGTNLISNSGPLTGGQGAGPTSWPGNWGAVSSWPTTTSTATYEYQICFKCHANYNTNYSSWGGSGAASWTDVALEFNPSNNSYHPVVSALGNPGSSQVPPAFTSIVIGDSGLSSTGKPSTYITDSTKNWATNQWVNWGLRIGWLGTPSSVDSSTTYNNVRTITSNISNTIYFPALSGTFTLSGYTTYSIEYYAGTGTKSGNTVTDSTKHFTTNNPYLPSPYLVGYVVVITNDIGTNVAKGTVTSCTDTSFTVGSWTNLPNTCNGGGSIPSDGTVGYYFSATGHTMMCSDCHSNDTISSTVAQGPHGSGVKWMLKGRNRAWPTTLATDNGTGSVGTGANLFGAYTANYPPLPSVVHRATNDGTVNGLFCLNCHSIVSFTKEGSGRHSTGNGVSCTLYSHTENPHELHSFACVNCHIMVPHGGKMSRLIGDGSSSDHMPVRYAFNNTLSNMYVYNFTKEADPGIYSGNDCYVDSVHCGNYHTGGSEAW